MRKVLLAAAAIIASAGIAQAQDRAYVAIAGGFDKQDDESIRGANAAGQARNINVGYNDGDYFGVSVGLLGAEKSYGRLRGEVEASYRSSKVKNFVFNGVARSYNESSKVSVAAGLVNFYYDSPKFYDRYRVFAGAGFGVAGVDHEIRYLVANAAATGGNLQILIPSSETTTAYQFALGGEVSLTPNFSFVADARYFDVGDVQVERYIGNTIINGVATNSGTLDSVLDADLSSTTFTLGFRYSF
jgi:opacity protein-like surface antigen